MGTQERISLNTQVFEFGPFRLDPHERVLLRDGKPTPLPPKAFDLLVVLVARAGRLVTREDLLKEVWAGTFVEEANLSYTVSLLRKALGDDAEPHVFIETVAKRGYRFKGAVDRHGDLESTTRPGNRRSRLWLFGLAILILISSLASWLVLRRPAHGSPGTLLRVAVVPPPGVTVLNAQISPDGQRIAFIGEEVDATKLWGSTARLWVQQLDSAEAVAVPGTEGAAAPFWAPDSQTVVICVDGQLRKINVSGGPAETLARVLCTGGANWGRGGVILFRTGVAEPLSQMAASGGARKPATQVDPSGKDRHYWPQFLPDGRHFLYVIHSDDKTRSGLWVGSLDALEFKQRLLDVEAPAIYGGGGYLLYSRDGSIVARPFDLTRLEFSGPASTVAYDREYAARFGQPEFAPVPREFTAGIAVHRLFGPFGRATFSASDTGRLAYSLFEPYEYQFAWLDRSGTAVGTIGEPGAFNTFDLSADGKRVVVARGKIDKIKLWQLEVERGALSQITFGDSFDMDPRWGPDGRIAWTSSKDGVRRIMERGLDGEETEVMSPGIVHDWSPDGHFLIYSWDARFALPLFGDQKKIPLFLGEQPKGGDQATFSNDGRLIAFHSAASGRVEVYVQHFPPSGEPKQISLNGGVQPVWRQDGLELYFLGLDGVLYAVTVDTRKFQFGRPTRLFQAPVGTLRGDIEQYTTNDGKRFLFLKPIDRRRRPIDLVIDWPMALKPPTRP